MSLKIFVVPFLIVTILILGIWYVKPEVNVIADKQAALVNKKEQVANMDAVLSNITALNNALDAKKESEQFILRYLPQQRDQNRIIDAFNFIAARSGLLITDMELKEITKETPRTSKLATENVFGVSGTSALKDNEKGDNISLASTMKAYLAKVTVKGTYENIKSFFDHVAHMDRLYKFNSFVINKEAENNSKVGNVQVLTGAFEAEFEYLLPKAIDTPLDKPVFQRAEWNLSTLDKALNKTTEMMPSAEKAQTGNRPNPFQ